MPQVPYQPYPTEKPQDRPTPSLNIATPAAAFGENVAHALSGLGHGIESAGNELFQRAMAIQNLQNETEAKEADAQYMMKAGELHANFSALQGKEAPAAYPKYMEDLQGLRQQIRGSLSNDMARKMYDSSSLSTMGRTIFNGAGHAATQAKVAAFGASSARVDMQMNTISQNPNDDVGFERLLRGAHGEIDAQGDIHGWDGAQVQDQKDKTTSTAWSHRIVGLSRTEPFRAAKMLEEHRDQIDRQDIDRVEKSVQAQVRNSGSRAISDEVNADLLRPPEAGKPEKTLQRRIDEGMAKAKKLGVGDDLFPDFVKARITSDYNQHKSVEREFELGNRNTVVSALNGDFGGKIPHNVDELKALDPKVAAAWDSLDAVKQHTYLNEMARLAKIGDRVDANESLKTRRQLQGMAQSDPVEFLAKDLFAEKMTMADRKAMSELQMKMTAKQEADPRVTRALQILKPDMNAAGIHTGRETRDQYNLYVGALQDALQVFQEEHKKSPTFDEVRKIGAQLMQEQATPWLLWPWATTPMYDLPVPSETVEQVKADVKAKSGVEPTDEQIKRAYIRKRYIELYGTKAKKGDKQLGGAEE